MSTKNLSEVSLDQLAAVDGGSCYTVCDNDYSYRYRRRYSASSCSGYSYSRPRTYRRSVSYSSSYYAARSTSPCTNVVINNSSIGDGAPYSWST